MKKLSFLFVAFALVGFIALSSCKSTTQPAEEAATEVVEEAAAAVDQAVDTTAEAAEAVAE
jgi:hypothetical protein